MKAVLFYSILIILLISNQLDAQTITSKELNGKWSYVMHYEDSFSVSTKSDTSIPVTLAFSNDSNIQMNSPMGNFSNNITYKIDNQNKETIIMLIKENGSTQKFYFKANKVKSDRINLIGYRVSQYNEKTKNWDDAELPIKQVLELTKIKD